MMCSRVLGGFVVALAVGAAAPGFASPEVLIPEAIAAAPATTGGFGLGLQAGSPSALTLKFAGAHESGFALGVGAGFGYGSTFRTSLWLQADYLIHLATLIDSDGVDLAVYGGPGVFASIFGANYGFGYAGNPWYDNVDYIGVGVRLPVGLSLAFDKFPLELYAQFDPAIGVFPAVGFGLGGAVGFRVYF
jgi:hypothetical protein